MPESLRASNPPRLTWAEVWGKIAHDMSSRSLCVRAHVGAVIVDSRNRIIDTGYNGPPEFFQHDDKPCTEWCPRSAGEETRLGRTNLGRVLDPEYNDCPALHAEANALMTCDRTVREGGTIYVTSHVCYGCAKLIANSGLRAVVVVLADDERDRAYRDPDRSYTLLEQCGVEVIVEAL